MYYTYRIMSTVIIQPKEKKEKNEQSLRDLEIISNGPACLMGVAKGEERENGAEQYVQINKN